jgi:hypothetical protein
MTANKERTTLLTPKGEQRQKRNEEICREYKRLKAKYPTSSKTRLCTYIATAYGLSSEMVKIIVREVA